MCYIDYSRLSPSDRPDTQDCVRRRAVLSVQSNPACPDREAAVKAVNEVWESCSNDTRPFDEVSWALLLPVCYCKLSYYSAPVDLLIKLL